MLNAETQKQAAKLAPYGNLMKQEYMTKLTPKHARKVFHIRTGTIDLRGVRGYKYGDNNSCRLCCTGEETIEHVVNTCPNVNRAAVITNINSTDCEDQKEMAKRCIEFQEKVDEKSEETE